MKIKYRIQFRRAVNQEWFARIVHRNGREIVRTSETYKHKSSCERALNNLILAMGAGDYTVE